MFEVQTKHVPEQRYVSRTRRVRVPELMPFIVKTVMELREQHEPAGPDFVLYHGAVNEDEDGPVEVCLPTVGGDKQLTAAEVAYTVANGAQCEFPEILGAYEAVARWAKEHGRELAGPPREINDFGDDEPPRMEIAWPIR